MKSKCLNLNGTCKNQKLNTLFLATILIQKLDIFKEKYLQAFWNFDPYATIRYKRNANKRSQGKQIAQLLPDGTICFAGKKLPVRIPSNQDKAAKLREALNRYVFHYKRKEDNLKPEIDSIGEEKWVKSSNKNPGLWIPHTSAYLLSPWLMAKIQEDAASLQKSILVCKKNTDGIIFYFFFLSFLQKFHAFILLFFA